MFSMFAGASDVNILGQVSTWNYSDHLAAFPGSCGKVEGVGDFFSPYLNSAKPAELYSNDLCRPIVLNYSKPVSLIWRIINYCTKHLNMLIRFT